MSNAIDVVHEDGRRTRMSSTWLAKVGAQQGWSAVTPDETTPTASELAAEQDVPTTVEDEPSTSEEA